MWQDKIGERIREARRSPRTGDQKKITQEALAQMIGSHGVYINHLERGKRKPSADFVQKVADATGYPIEWFFREDEATATVPTLPATSEDLAAIVQAAQNKERDSGTPGIVELVLRAALAAVTNPGVRRM